MILAWASPFKQFLLHLVFDKYFSICRLVCQKMCTNDRKVGIWMFKTTRSQATRKLLMTYIQYDARFHHPHDENAQMLWHALNKWECEFHL